MISASLYSLGCPTLAHRLVDHYEMDPTTDKYHITGVGCASGVPLMRLAAQTLREHAAQARAGRRRREHERPADAGRTPTTRKAKIVGSALFGDGCGAALLSAGHRAPQGPAILASQVHQIGEYARRRQPAVQRRRQLPAPRARAARPRRRRAARRSSTRFLRHNRLQGSDIDHWLVHPGGRRIIENVQAALELSDEDVATSWRALAEHGNVGTPSIFYVLKDAIEHASRRPGERGLMVTIGPGVTVGLMLLGW